MTVTVRTVTGWFIVTMVAVRTVPGLTSAMVFATPSIMNCWPGFTLKARISPEGCTLPTSVFPETSSTSPVICRLVTVAAPAASFVWVADCA